jgi:thioredoxin
MADSYVVRCPQCGSNNRIPQDKLAEGTIPVCGKCKTALPLHLKPVAVSDATFSAEIERSPLPVVVDMWAPWCGPCRTIAPTIDALATEMVGRVKFAKINIDQNPATAARYSVSSIPTLLVLKNGQLLDRIVGAVPKSEIASRLHRVLPF